MAGRNDQINVRLLARVKAFLDAERRRQPADERCQKAWAWFYRQCDPVIRRFASRYVGSASDLDDCVQEVWVHLVERLVRFEYDPQRGQFKTWLYRVVRDTTISYFRQQHRDRYSEVGTTAFQATPAPGADPAQLCETSEDTPVLDKMLGQIRKHVSKPNYQLLRMRWLLGCSVEETATALNISPKQVWYREHRARKKLRSVMASRAR